MKEMVPYSILIHIIILHRLNTMIAAIKPARGVKYLYSAMEMSIALTVKCYQQVVK